MRFLAKVKPLFCLIAIIGIGTANPAFALPNHVTISSSNITSIYDGDTFRAYLPGITPHGQKSTRIRIRHLDTPEIKGRCLYEKSLALRARNFGRKLLFGAHTITLSNLDHDRYGRLLATVTLNNHISYSKQLIAAQLARSYNGGHRLGWCTN
ncbi:thermonuclease family protein [Photobacterium damselae]|uniref:thermonuclease family protein n=1 Tax=Photobacterium damselae TaxID=38293 RepID=UPI004067A3F8